MNTTTMKRRRTRGYGLLEVALGLGVAAALTAGVVSGSLSSHRVLAAIGHGGGNPTSSSGPGTASSVVSNDAAHEFLVAKACFIGRMTFPALSWTFVPGEHPFGIGRVAMAQQSLGGAVSLRVLDASRSADGVFVPSNLVAQAHVDATDPVWTKPCA